MFRAMITGLKGWGAGVGMVAVLSLCFMVFPSVTAYADNTCDNGLIDTQPLFAQHVANQDVFFKFWTGLGIGDIDVTNQSPCTIYYRLDVFSIDPSNGHQTLFSRSDSQTAAPNVGKTNSGQVRIPMCGDYQWDLQGPSQTLAGQIIHQTPCVCPIDTQANFAQHVANQDVFFKFWTNPGVASLDVTNYSPCPISYQLNIWKINPANGQQTLFSNSSMQTAAPNVGKTNSGAIGLPSCGDYQWDVVSPKETMGGEIVHQTACAPPAPPAPPAPAPACSSNTDCGASGYTGGLFCGNGGVYQNYTTYTCNNPGQASASCSNATEAKLVQACVYGCAQNACMAPPAPPANNSNTNANGNANANANGNDNTNHNNNDNNNANNNTNNNTNNSSTNVSVNVTCNGSNCNGGNNNTTGTIACSSNADCGNPQYLDGLMCQGNAVYQNYRTWTCNNPGTTSSYCSPKVQNQQLYVCSGNQTCQGAGQCVGGGGGSCTPHAYQQCVGNGVYWFNSCGQQDGLVQQCSSNQTCQSNTCVNNNNNYCTANSYQQCSGNAVYWFDSCGNRQGLVAQCSYNQTCQSNTCVNSGGNYGGQVTKMVRNLSSGNLNWSNSVPAAPGDILQFQVTINNTSGQYLNNVTLHDALPANLYYNNNVTVNGAPNSGSITSGLNLGSLSSGQTDTVVYQVQVAAASNFTYGTVTLTNSASASSDQGGTLGTASASVMVNRTGVLGATSVSTGLTNNFWMDSFFLPLMLLILLIWSFASGMLRLPAWAGNIVARSKTATAAQKLAARIASIKKKEGK